MFCDYSKSKIEEPDEENNLDPCTGFPTTHKAKLSIPTISWNKWWQDTKLTESLNSQTVTMESEAPVETHPRQWIGLVLTVLSALTFSFTALLSKLLHHVDSFNLGTWMFLLMTVISGVHFMCWQIFTCRGTNRPHNGFLDNSGKLTLYIIVSCPMVCF